MADETTKTEAPKEEAPKAPKAEAPKKEASKDAPTGLAGTAAAAPKIKKGKRQVAEGKAYILSSFNNTLITMTDTMGNAVAWSSAGSKGFAGSRKNTPFAAQVAAEEAARKAADVGMRSCKVYVSGPGAGRESTLRAISSVGIRITYIEDITPIPHNGCRPPKRRRV